MLSVSQLEMVAYIYTFGMRQEDCCSLEARLDYRVRSSLHLTLPREKQTTTEGNVCGNQGHAFTPRNTRLKQN